METWNQRFHSRTERNSSLSLVVIPLWGPKVVYRSVWHPEFLETFLAMWHCWHLENRRWTSQVHIEGVNFDGGLYRLWGSSSLHKPFPVISSPVTTADHQLQQRAGVLEEKETLSVQMQPPAPFLVWKRSSLGSYMMTLFLNSWYPVARGSCLWARRGLISPVHSIRQLSQVNEG